MYYTQWVTTCVAEEGFYVEQQCRNGNLPWRCVDRYGPMAVGEIGDLLDVLVWVELTGRSHHSAAG